MDALNTYGLPDGTALMKSLPPACCPRKESKHQKNKRLRVDKASTIEHAKKYRLKCQSVLPNYYADPHNQQSSRPLTSAPFYDFDDNTAYFSAPASSTHEPPNNSSKTTQKLLYSKRNIDPTTPTASTKDDDDQVAHSSALSHVRARERNKRSMCMVTGLPAQQEVRRGDIDSLSRRMLPLSRTLSDRNCFNFQELAPREYAFKTIKNKIFVDASCDLLQWNSYFHQKLLFAPEVAMNRSKFRADLQDYPEKAIQYVSGDSWWRFRENCTLYIMDICLAHKVGELVLHVTLQLTDFVYKLAERGRKDERCHEARRSVFTGILASYSLAVKLYSTPEMGPCLANVRESIKMRIFDYSPEQWVALPRNSECCHFANHICDKGGPERQWCSLAERLPAAPSPVMKLIISERDLWEVYLNARACETHALEYLELAMQVLNPEVFSEQLYIYSCYLISRFYLTCPSVELEPQLLATSVVSLALLIIGLKDRMSKQLKQLAKINCCEKAYPFPKCFFSISGRTSNALYQRYEKTHYQFQTRCDSIRADPNQLAIKSLVNWV
eukprot:GHVH01005948.1.p1 GENE.GHVH01005948.1~~GHVH01005948.1.p1  ORF type:complete len:555 (+),score=51.79 GHVH01005948.1:785-2449(+)